MIIDLAVEYLEEKTILIIIIGIRYIHHIH
jgi:hypothetical protein